MKTNILVLTSVILFSHAWALASPAPSPAVVPADNEWTLNTIFTSPQQISVRLPGHRRPQRFWYIILTLTNNSKLDADFYPKCELMTDAFDLTAAYKDTKNIVFNQIKKRHNKKFPFLESLESADNKILQGSDQAKDMVIIWPDFDSKARNITLFIAGLSNETLSVTHPTKKDANGQPLKLYLRKTLELKYSIGGDEKFRDKAKLIFKAKRWIMR